MTFALPDGQPIGADVIRRHDTQNGLTVVDDVGGFYLSFLNPEDEEQPWRPMDCRAPGNYAVVSSRDEDGTTLYPISAVHGPSPVDETVVVKSDRTVTKATDVSGGISVSLGVLELQTGVKMSETVTTKASESTSVHLKKGERVVLVARFIYHVHTIRRTAYSGPNCQPYEQSGSVLTPFNTDIFTIHPNY